MTSISASSSASASRPSAAASCAKPTARVSSYVVDRLEGYADKYGARLAPAQLLVDMAKKGLSFHKD